MKELKIKNFKCLEDFQMTELKPVNLLTGRNNSGKSTVLEAISIFASRGSFEWMSEILFFRGEPYGFFSTSIPAIKIKMFASFITERKELINSDYISINTEEDEFSMRLVKYHEEILKKTDKNGHEVITHQKYFSETGEKYGLELMYNSESIIADLELAKSAWVGSRDKVPSNIFVTTSGDNKENIIHFWDKIVLTEKENIVVEALRIIESQIERLSFVGEDSKGGRYPVVKLKNSDKIYPLKSMGDGVNRILRLVLAMVNCDNGYLLIDEIENGLHYSAQEQLWKVIFELSARLNVQVFATTHSNDTINSYAKVLENSDFEGSLYRMAVKESGIRAFHFSKEEIAAAAGSNINLR